MLLILIAAICIPVQTLVVRLRQFATAQISASSMVLFETDLILKARDNPAIVKSRNEFKRLLNKRFPLPNAEALSNAPLLMALENQRNTLMPPRARSLLAAFHLHSARLLLTCTARDEAKDAARCAAYDLLQQSAALLAENEAVRQHLAERQATLDARAEELGSATDTLEEAECVAAEAQRTIATLANEKMALEQSLQEHADIIARLSATELKLTTRITALEGDLDRMAQAMGEHATDKRTGNEAQPAQLIGQVVTTGAISVRTPTDSADGTEPSIYSEFALLLAQEQEGQEVRDKFAEWKNRLGAELVQARR